MCAHLNAANPEIAGPHRARTKTVVLVVQLERTLKRVYSRKLGHSHTGSDSLVSEFVKPLNGPPRLRSVSIVPATIPRATQHRLTPPTVPPTLSEACGSVDSDVSESAPLVGVDSGLRWPLVLASKRRNGRAGVPGCERPLGASTPERAPSAPRRAHRLDQPSVGLAPTQRKPPRTPRPKGGGRRVAVRGGCCE